ncbi:hypothetical protein [Micromonospora sp. DT31]
MTSAPLAARLPTTVRSAGYAAFLLDGDDNRPADDWTEVGTNT